MIAEKVNIEVTITALIVGNLLAILVLILIGLVF